jgi:polyisoprenoid-binding protein YceI
MTKARLLPLAMLLLVHVACDNDPGKGKSKATVAEAVSVAPLPTTPAAAIYRFSNEDSKVEFVGAKVTRKHDGSFGKFSGAIEAPDGKPESSRLSAEIDIASITADEAKLTGHLKSPDFFDVARFPGAKFTSTSVTPGGDKGATHTITGNLEMHGVTKSISFPATVKLTPEAADASAEFVINRKDFGIVYAGMADDLIKDEVAIKLSIHAKKI